MPLPRTLPSFLSLTSVRADLLLAIFICFLGNAHCVIKANSCQLCSYPLCHLSPKSAALPTSLPIIMGEIRAEKRRREFYWRRDKCVAPFSAEGDKRRAAAACTQSFAPRRGLLSDCPLRSTPVP